MSETLGDRLRAATETWAATSDHIVLRAAALEADEYEAVALARSAEGRGPHAAAVLRWAAQQASDRRPFAAAWLWNLAEEAER